MVIDNAFVQHVLKIAKEAGQGILAIYNSKVLEIKTKQDTSPVTQADLLAHDIILEKLSLFTPAIPILSEEDTDFSYEKRKVWKRYWLVDPLDGTKEFIQRNGQFTVNIALIDQNRPILGVIFAPLQDRSYYAAQGVGAFKEEEGETSKLLTHSWQPGTLEVVATRREIHTQLYERLQTLGKINVVYRGSSLKFCLIAEGRADFYLRKKPIHEWDTAAGQCIVEEAGGLVLDLNWQPLRYNVTPHLLNPPFIVIGDSKQLLPNLKSMPIFKEI